MQVNSEGRSVELAIELPLNGDKFCVLSRTGMAKPRGEKRCKNFFIFSNSPLDAGRICSTIAILNGQANNDVAWPLVSLQDTILFFYKLTVKPNSSESAALCGKHECPHRATIYSSALSVRVPKFKC